MEMNISNYIEYKKSILKKRVEGLDSKTLLILTDGVDKQCETYMKSKVNVGGEITIKCDVIKITSVAHLEETMDYAEENGYPLILQLPIAKELEEYYNKRRTKNDVDGFFEYQSVADGDYSIVPATPKACLNFIKDREGLNINLRGKTVVIVGRGKLVGYPLAMMMMNEGATVTVINTTTDKVLRHSVLRKADIVVLATGHKGSVKDYELSSNKDVYVLNVGTCFDDNGKLTTELFVTHDNDKIHYTPRIRGIGILTVLNLMENVVNFYEEREKEKSWKNEY